MRTIGAFAALLLAGGGCGGSDKGGPGGTETDTGRAPDGTSPAPAPPTASDPAPALETGPPCTVDGWCWESPLPAGGVLTGVWAVGPDDVWAASQTDLWHWDGAALAHVRSPGPTPYGSLAPVWGAAPDDVWVGWFGEMLHWDGVRWSEVPGVLHSVAIHGVATDDAWSVGEGMLHHYDGAAWTQVPASVSASHRDVWAVGTEQAVVVGTEAGVGFAQLWTGTTATDLALPDSALAVAVYASAPDDVWVSDDVGLRHLRGGAWTLVAPDVDVVDMWGDGPDDVWFLPAWGDVLRWDGATLEPVPFDGFQSRTITGTSASDVWVGTLTGALHHYDGTGWTAVKSTLVDVTILDVAVAEDGEGWAVTAVDLLRRDPDGTWAPQAPPTDALLERIAVAVAEVLLFADGEGWRRSGTGWDSVDGAAGLVDACATADGTVWGVGDRVARLSGDTWVDEGVVPWVALGRVLCDGDEAWATAVTPAGLGEDRTALLHFDGAAWRHEGLWSLIGAEIRSAYAPSADAAWVVAADPATEATLALRWDGSRWVELDTARPVLGVGGTSATDVWLVGEGYVARDTGAGPVEVPGAPAGRLRWVHAEGGGAAQVVAEDGAIWSTDGATWTSRVPPLQAPLISDLLVDVGFSGGVAYGAGDGGEALTAAGGAWGELPGLFRADAVEAGDGAGVWFLDGSRLGRWTGARVEDEGFADGVLVVPSDGADAVLVGDDGEVRVWSGSAFASDGATDARSVAGAFGASLRDLWVLGETDERDGFHVQRRVAGAWSEHLEPLELVAVGRSTGGDRIALDATRALWQQDGTGWTLLSAAPDPGRDGPASGALIVDEGEVWAQALGGILRFDGAWRTDTEQLAYPMAGLVPGGAGVAWAFGPSGWIVSGPGGPHPNQMSPSSPSGAALDDVSCDAAGPLSAGTTPEPSRSSRRP